MSAITSVQGYGPVSQSNAATLSVIDVTTSAAATATDSTVVYTSTTIPSTHVSSSARASSSAARTTAAATTNPADPSSTATTASSSYISVQTGSPSPSAFTYIQLDGDNLQPYGPTFFDQASFSTLCPSGDCYQACQDYSHLLNVDSYIFNDTSSTNVTSSGGQITLFGICTNIKSITDIVTSNPQKVPRALSYFSNQDEQDMSNQIPRNISMCLYDTCQRTRDPAQCHDLCWPGDLMTDTPGVMDLNGVSKCLRQLCSNVCGLPYANQDVFGIGVLWSYAIQAAVIIAYTIWLTFMWVVRKMIEPSDHVRSVAKALGCSTFVRNVSQPGTKRFRSANWLLTFSKKVNEAAVLFLVAECLFGVSIVTAAMLQGPSSIDPVNGYALLSVAITGFLPPIFTLMLLHSQKSREWRPWFATILVFTTWAVSSVLFWLLFLNLSNMMGANNDARVAAARNSLFNVTTCGGYSAMSLCQENMHNDPIQYMMKFYNWNRLPSIQTVWIPWVSGTTVFFTVVTLRFLHTLFNPKSRPHSTVQTWLVRIIWILSTGGLMFSFVYQLLMYLRYREMKIIDTENWTFGQVVALMVWAPVILDVFFRPGLDHIQEKFRNRKSKNSTGTGTKSVRTSTSSQAPLYSKSGYTHIHYQPLGQSSPALDP